MSQLAVLVTHSTHLSMCAHGKDTQLARAVLHDLHTMDLFSEELGNLTGVLIFK